MRSSTILPLLAIGAAALPHNTDLFRRADVCTGYEFTSGDPAKDSDLWVKTGAATFLVDFINKNGITDWTDKFFQKVVAGGTQLGSTHDCGAFPSDGQCNGPDETPCKTYNPPETFYIHLAIHNLYAAFSTIHEKMQDNAIYDMGATTNAVTKKWGPPTENQDVNFMAILIGVACLASAIEGFGVTAAFIIGGLNIMAGGMAAGPAATDANTYRGTLQDVTSRIFKSMADGLEDTVKGIFDGKFQTTNGGKVGGKAPQDVIMNEFGNGVLVDSNLVDPLVDKWNDRMAAFMQDALIRAGWLNMQYPVGLLVTAPGVQVKDPKQKNCDPLIGCTKRIPMDEATCIYQDGRIWVKEGCLGFSNTKADPTLGPQISYFTTDDVMDLSKLIGDYQGAMQNALDCINAGSVDGKKLKPTGKPQTDFTNVDLAKPPAYPACFWNLGFKWITS